MNDKVSCIIEKGCRFIGDLVFEGVARLGGEFKGNIYTNDTVIIGETAFVDASIDANDVIICGELVGNVIARNKIEIRKTALIKGNLSAPVVTMADGVIFDGKINIIQN